MTEQPTEAARVKVADIGGFDSWRFFRWLADFGAELSEFWLERGFTVTKESAIKECRRAIKRDRDGEARLVVARYPLDPDALYFDRDHSEGVPVEWEDVR